MWSAAVMTFVGDAAFAIPAKPGLLTVRQSDGTELRVRLMGDEHAHYYLSEDGYLLINDNDTFYYGNADAAGNIVRSAIIARPAASRTPEARLFLENVDMKRVMEAMARRDAGKPSRAPRRAHVGLFETGFPSMGEQKGLVVLVEYTDVKFNLSDPYDYFHRMLNEPGFSDYGGTGCAAEYFRECSKNRFRPQFDVYGPVTLSHSMSYYGGNDYGGDDKNPQKMAIEACQQLDGTVDFSEYDRDGDGYIDNVFVFYAGRGEASGGSANTVWPHAWNVTSAEYTSYFFDGVQLDRYACSNEWEGSRPDGVGTFIHEFSHVMGLPDLYATDYTNAFTPGAWSVLDYGPYNNDGCTPPLYSIYERYALGWIEPTVLDAPATISLNGIGDNRGCMIPTGDENEFFLVENRQQTGWDTYIPGHGMLVWHVDYDPTVWNQNEVNNSASHQYVDLEEADGTRSEYSRAGDVFPGTAGVTSFTDDTYPSMKTWAGKRLNLPITEIKEQNGIITFKVAGGSIVPRETIAEEATDVTPVSFTAHWQAVEDAVDYYISVYTKDAEGMKTCLGGYNKRNVGDHTSTKVTGLAPHTMYYYTVYAGNDAGELSGESNEMGVATLEMTFVYLEPVALAVSDVTPTSFTANWETLDDAKEYILNIYSKIYGDPEKDGVDFTEGVKNLPEGWKTNSTLSYANKSYSGAAIPSLRFIQSGNYIESPEYSLPVRRLSFWQRGSKASEDNRIIVSAWTKDNRWIEVVSVNIENGAGGTTSVIDTLPDETYKIRITYNMPGNGSLAIDDVIVEWGGDVETAGEMQKKIEAPANSFVVDDLAPATTYYYRVQASDGEQVSMWSNEVRVTTTSDMNSSIDRTAVANAKAVLSLSGDLLDISGAEGETIIVTDVCGRTVFSSTPRSATDNVAVHLPSRGIYIVRIGQSRAIKIKR